MLKTVLGLRCEFNKPPSLDDVHGIVESLSFCYQFHPLCFCLHQVTSPKAASLWRCAGRWRYKMRKKSPLARTSSQWRATAKKSLCYKVASLTKKEIWGLCFLGLPLHLLPSSTVRKGVLAEWGLILPGFPKMRNKSKYLWFSEMMNICASHGDWMLYGRAGAIWTHSWNGNFKAIFKHVATNAFRKVRKVKNEPEHHGTLCFNYLL